MPTRSSTGSRPPARAGGRCCRSARPTTSARPTRPRRRSRPGAACSPIPRRPSLPAELAAFREANGYWIEDWERAGGSVADQVRFEREWTALRGYARERGIGLIGDVPIYVAQGSVDHLAHPELFLDGVVAGAPPDPLGPLGQHWGNPLFDWDAVAKDGYRWWIERLRRTLALFDLTRIDHFRGFADFWAIPEGELDARTGHWLPGPREPLFRAAEAELGPLPVIAEDLGVITPDVEELRDALGFPGMVVMLWAVRPTENLDSPHRFENHREHQVIYTTTHDTDTLRGHFPDSRAVGADRARPRLPSGSLHDPGAGRPRPRQRRPDEHARRAARQLGLAARAGSADSSRSRDACVRSSSPPDGWASRLG